MEIKNLRTKHILLGISIVVIMLSAFCSYRYVTANKLHLQAIELQEAGKLNEAKKVYTKAIQLNPWHADATYQVGVIMRDQGKLSEAERLMKRAVALDKNEFDYNLGLGFLYLNNLKNTKAAKIYLERAYNQKSSDYFACLMMGLLAERSDKEAKIAVFYYKKATELEPNLAAAHKQLALLYSSKGMEDKATRSWQSVLKVNPKDKDAQLHLQPKR